MFCFYFFTLDLLFRVVVIVVVAVVIVVAAAAVVITDKTSCFLQTAGRSEAETGRAEQTG